MKLPTREDLDRRSREAQRKLPDRTPTSRLVAAIGHGDFFLRYRARNLLQERGAKAVPSLIQALGAPDPEARAGVAQVLSWIAADQNAKASLPRAVPPLRKLLGDPSPEVRLAAASALLAIDPRAAEAVRAVVGLLDGKGSLFSEVMSKALPEVLGDLVEANPAARPALEEAAAGEDSRKARGARRALRLAPRKAASRKRELESALRGLRSSDASARSSAALGLAFCAAKVDAPRATRALARALRDRSSDVRSTASFALGRLGPDAQEAVPALLHRLRGRDAEERSLAAEALGKIGAPEALQPLGKAMRDPSKEVRRRAAEALEEIRSLSPHAPERPGGTGKRGLPGRAAVRPREPSAGSRPS